jgi:hypothetical protein
LITWRAKRDPKPSFDAMASTRTALSPVGLIRESVRLYFAAFGRLFVIAFLPSLVLATLTVLTGTGALVPLDPVAGTTATGSGFGTLVIVTALDLLVWFGVGGVATLSAIDTILGKQSRTVDHLRRVLRNSGPILVLGTLLSVVAGIGLVLFVLPGLYIMARFLPWIAVVAAEDAGWAGLTRAQELTEGSRMRISVAVFLIAAFGIGAALLLGPVVALAASAGIAALVVLEAVGTAFYYGLSAAFTALVYVRLRQNAVRMSAPELS